jgi:hypothetical protein
VCNFDQNFQANLDYWIYSTCKHNRNETIDKLQKILRYGSDEPDEILLDVARSLQKLENMPEDKFEENNNLFPFQRKYYEQLEKYDEHVQISREIEREISYSNLNIYE